MTVGQNRDQNYTHVVYFYKYFPHSQTFSLMSTAFRIYAHILCQIKIAAFFASTCAFLAYTGSHQVENIYRDGL